MKRPKFAIWKHKRWLDVVLPVGFLTVVWRKGWRKSYAYWSMDATPQHERVRWLWGRRNYWRHE